MQFSHESLVLWRLHSARLLCWGLRKRNKNATLVGSFESKADLFSVFSISAFSGGSSEFIFCLQVLSGGDILQVAGLQLGSVPARARHT